ncbi:MAG: hypothetical protein V1932_07670, partial [Chloroflexota bacterium]
MNKLLYLIEEMPAYRQLMGELEHGGSTRVAVLDAAKPYLVAALYRSLHRPVMVVTAQPESAKKLHEQLSVWCDSSQLKLLTEPDALPYESIASNDTTEIERLQVLSSLANIAGDDSTPTTVLPLIISSAPAFMQKVAPYSDFAAACHTIKLGTEVEPFDLLSQWQAIG